MSYVFSILVGYIFGCINGSQLIGFFKKVDIKNTGVKNAGASNTTIVLGWKYGIIVALIDIFKGIAAIFLWRTFADSFHFSTDPFFIILIGAFVIVGHNYPATMKFKGGKGTASFIGLLFAVDWKIGLTCFLLLVIVTLLTDYLVIGVATLYISFLLLLTMFDYDYASGIVALCLTVLSAIKHRENFQRIRLGTETRISKMFKKKSSS